MCVCVCMHALWCACVCVCMMSVIVAEKATLSVEIRLKLLCSCAAAAELHTRLMSRQDTDFKDQLIFMKYKTRLTLLSMLLFVSWVRTPLIKPLNGAVLRRYLSLSGCYSNTVGSGRWSCRRGSCCWASSINMFNFLALVSTSSPSSSACSTHTHTHTRSHRHTNPQSSTNTTEFPAVIDGELLWQ